MKDFLEKAMTTDISNIIDLLNKLEECFDALIGEKSLEDDAVNFKQFCETTNRDFDAYGEQDVEAYVHAIVIYTAYLQGIKDGQAQLTLDLEKFNKSRERYLGKKKNSKFAGTLLNHIKED